MTPADWAIVQKHFEALCDLTPEDQAAALDRLALGDESRAQLEQLLAFDGAADLDEVAGQVGQLASALDGASLAGSTIGAYRLIKLLGEGGMGEVYLAERADGRFDAQVAIKFVATQGGSGQRMFDRERRILARLNHPDIAYMIDAGEHPRFGAYLVMEFVDGLPLDRFLAESAPGPLEILAWIARAARAVAFAHQNLILHRDLKPEHLMVTGDGQLKVLDFGVAMLLEPESGQLESTARPSFTPRYAAPEQLLDQSSTTRTDVYALGLILYQLLGNGVSPFGDDPQRLAERKLAGQAARLARIDGLRARQQRDLSAVIDKAIARRPEDRYPGPADLAVDLEAIGQDLPTAVRRASLPELCWRWFQRHRLAGAAMLVAVLALVGGTGFSTWFAHQAQLDRDAALFEARKSLEIANFLESIFETASPGIERGPDLRARDLLQQGRERIATELADEPVVAASLELSMARSYLNLGLYQDGLALLQSSRPDLPPLLTAERQILSARLIALIGDFEQSLAELDLVELDGLPGNVVAEAAVLRATALINLGQSELAEQAARIAVETADSSDKGLDMQLAGKGLQGAVAFGRADYQTAQIIFTDIHQLSMQRFGAINDMTGMALNNLAATAFMNGDLETSLRSALAAVDTYEQFFGVDNRAMALALRGLGLTYRRLNQIEQADATFLRTAAALKDWNGDDNLLYQEAVLQRLELLALLGRHTELLELLAELPPADVPGGLDSRAVVCRLDRLKQVFGGAPLSGSDCMAGLSLPNYVQAFDLYLRVLEAQAAGSPQLAEIHAAAAQTISELLPPDPLLNAAVDWQGQEP